jgi:hypothetical protein
VFFLFNENYVLFNYRYYIFLCSNCCKGNINGKDGLMSMHSGTSKGKEKLEKVDKQKLVNLISTFFLRKLIKRSEFSRKIFSLRWSLSKEEFKNTLSNLSGSNNFHTCHGLTQELELSNERCVSSNLIEGKSNKNFPF